ncbi:MAG: hypothetical protein EOP06_06975 [Proteobacteria bacterium]|nr:MAG: hypothetical protein EOP06_06975 [Pseudomonadota bacterium]
MRGIQSFLIRARPSLLDLLEGGDEFFHYLRRDVIITAHISDRHGLDFRKIFEQIKGVYMSSVRASIPRINSELGFDYYWDFELYDGRVIALSEILRRAEPLDDGIGDEELKYLIQANQGQGDDSI